MLVYDVVLSFAGEDRAYVEKVAYLLKGRGIKVFYDKFETSKLFGKDLYQFLNDTYKNKARYCVIFISSNYVKKKWTKHELRSAQARSFESDEEYILPIYIEDVDLPGLNKTIGYLDIKEFSEEEIVDIIEEKLDDYIDKKYIYSTLSDFWIDLVVSYIVIGGQRELFLFEKKKDEFKTFLLNNVYYINKDLYLASCSLLDDIEQRLETRKTEKLTVEENVKENFSFAVNLYSKMKKTMDIIQYYISNNFDDNIDFFQVGETMGLFEKSSENDLKEVVEEIIHIMRIYDNEEE